MSPNKLIATLITSALLATNALAADEKKAADAAPAASDAAQKADKPKAKPHKHMDEGGRGTSPASGAATADKKKALHDHNKEHKQR